MKILKRRRGSPAQRLIAAADQARDRHDWAAAARDYAAALALAPARADIWVQYGHMLKETARRPEAVEAYNRAIALEPEIADTHFHLGYLKRSGGDLEGAADHFLRAVELDPSWTLAVAELRALAQRGVEMDEARVARVLPMLRKPLPAPRRSDSLHDLKGRLESLLARSRVEPSGEAKTLIKTLRAGVEAATRLEALETEAGRTVAHVVFDISDLVGYFDNARLPTGIQRVQIEVISALLREPTPGLEVQVCSFTSERDSWVAVPDDVFLSLAEMSLASGDLTEPGWKAALDDLKLLIALSPALVFQRGAYLINLGTSWWLQNYFLHVRRAKAAWGVRYIPFVHDLIPIMTPEHCVRRLTQDFISWASGVFAHADHFFTNSEASKKDLLTVAGILGAHVDPDNVHVVRLNADFRKPVTETPMADTLGRYGLAEGEFVLFVSTIESRKNHLAAFAAWIELAEKHGVDAVPRLVCVGNRGWLNDAVFTKVESHPVLRSRVMMVSGVSDPDLANLYRASRFTLYPSMYEGWGLPVTESLCYGKAVLLSDSSSLPEAGGEFAVYYPLGDQPALVAALERLMFDAGWRGAIEARLVDFKPRPWRDLGVEIGDQIAAWFASDAGETASMSPALAAPGRYYWMRRVLDTHIAPGMVATEIFRTGDGWWAPDDDGVWTRGKGGALAMRLPSDLGPARLYLGLKGLLDRAVNFKVLIGGVVVESGAIRRRRSQWLTLPITPDQVIDGVLRVEIRGDVVQDFGLTSTNGDQRVISVGVTGFMICAEDDAVARADMLDAIAFDTLPQLADRYLTQGG